MIGWMWLLMLPTASVSSDCKTEYSGAGIGTVGDEEDLHNHLVTLDPCIDTGIEYIQVHHANIVDGIQMKCIGGVSVEGVVVGEENDMYSLPCKDADPPGIANISASLYDGYEDDRNYLFNMYVTCVDGAKFGPYGTGSDR